MSAVELRAAAAKIRDAAGRATYIEGRWRVDVAVLTNAQSWLGPSHDVLTSTWLQAIHVNLWDPRTAVLVATLLDVVAHDMDENPGIPSYGWDEALNLAREINGGAR